MAAWFVSVFEPQSSGDTRDESLTIATGSDASGFKETRGGQIGETTCQCGFMRGAACAMENVLLNTLRALSPAWKGTCRIVPALVMMSVLAACASRPINEPIATVDPEAGYRPNVLIPQRENNDPETLFVLSFSGGGTRAAALSFGVLEELKRTNITVNGKPRRLIDEVDLITGVSGGSFTALAYALHGEKLFTEYEERFLKRDVQGAIMWRTINPLNWGKLLSGNYGRSELAAEYYDEILFDNATFADLIERPGPVAIATGTDMSIGTRFTFYQDDFDLICSKLDSVRLSRAAATSSAVPVMLSPVTFNNYGGNCDYEYPEWVEDILVIDEHERPAGRAIERYLDMAAFTNSEKRPFLHLVDGGVSDNIGVRGVLETLQEAFISHDFAEERGIDRIRKVIIIVANAHSEQAKTWQEKESPPGLIAQALQSSGVPIDSYSFETIELMKDRAAVAQWRRDLRVAQARLGGMSEAEAEASIPKMDIHVLEVTFDRIADQERRKHLQDLPTSFVLPDEDVDELRQIAGELMRQSPDYKEILNSFETKTIE
jgi:NTE family protein